MKIKIILSILIYMNFNLGFSQVDTEINFISSDSIENYIKVKNLSFENQDIYVLKNLESFKTYSQGYLKSPVIFVFNADGEYVDLINNVNAEKKLSKFKRINNKTSEEYPGLNFWKERISHFESGDLLKDTPVEYTFILNWGLLFGDIENIEMIDHWYKVLLRQKANGKNIKIVLLNVDLQKSWNLSPKMEKWVLNNVNNQI
ncbi:hypothetical protein SAMN04488096_101178 [Mesonia phycicola]|uniref:Uncharacterized protein n=2 Tax=Mesonia phycicola TaxID=579105 RepID=A0A1M6AAV7_9FLAO|nr:hypothetical protein SAMN04488096_101178 [Mesonia phycicola]